MTFIHGHKSEKSTHSGACVCVCVLHETISLVNIPAETDWKVIRVNCWMIEAWPRMWKG